MKSMQFVKHSSVDKTLSLGLVVVAVGLYLSLWDKGLNSMDEGVGLIRVERVLGGQIPYRDFASLVTPGQYYFEALLMHIFGTSILVARTIAFVVGACSAIAVYFLGRSILPPWYAVLAGLLPLGWGISHTPPAFVTYTWLTSLLGLLMVAILARSVGKRLDRRQAAVVGVFGGAAVLTKQNLGGYLVTAIVLWLIVDGLFFSRQPTLKGRLRDLIAPLTCFLFPVVAFIASFITFLWLNRALDGFYSHALVTPFASSAVESKVPFPGLEPLVVTGNSWLGTTAATYLKYVFYLPLLVFVLVGVVLRRSFAREIGREGRLLTLFLLFGTVMLANLYPRATPGQLSATILPFASILGLYIVHRLASWISSLAPEKTRFIHAAATGVFLVFLVLPGFVLTARNYQGLTAPLATAAGTVFVAPEVATEIREVTDAIERKVPPSELLLIIPKDPMLYYLTGRRNPTRFDLVVPGDVTRADIDALIADAERLQINHILVSEETSQGLTLAQHSLTLSDYIEKNFRTVETVGRFRLMRRP
ncbi:MAG: glycosyltransferase family 39 protein [Chloroflexi bacterium]|nr:glycosyltransferase family 39 protein [Chloroflexota bacterium]